MCGYDFEHILQLFEVLNCFLFKNEPGVFFFFKISQFPNMNLLLFLYW